MFSKIRHQGCFRNSCPGWCPLVTDLVIINLSGKVDGKALENPHCDAGQCHVHFNGADGFQNFLAWLFTFHLPQGVPVLLSSGNS